MLVSPRYYYGLPPHLVDAYESILQGVVSELFDLAQQIWQTQSDRNRSYGDMDYVIRKTDDALLIEDHSAGWWGWLSWNSSSDKMTEFRLHVEAGALPKVLCWKDLDNPERQSIWHFQVTREDSQDSWSGPFHQMNLKHPLRHALIHAMSELSEET